MHILRDVELDLPPICRFRDFLSPQAPRVSCRPPTFAIVLEQENGYRMSISLGTQDKKLGRPEPETGDFLIGGVALKGGSPLPKIRKNLPRFRKDLPKFRKNPPNDVWKLGCRN